MARMPIPLGITPPFPKHPPAFPTLLPGQVRVGSSRDGVHVSALREIRALRELGCSSCPHVVSLLDVFPNKAGTSLCLVFEYLDWWVAGLPLVGIWRHHAVL